jgi:hypothetical protein
MRKVNLPRLHKCLCSPDAAVYEPARQQLGELSADSLLALLRMDVKCDRGKQAGRSSVWLPVLADIATGFIHLLFFRTGGKHFGFGGESSHDSPVTPLPEKELGSTQRPYIEDALAKSRDPRAAAAILEAVLMSSFLSGRLTLTLEDRLLAVIPDHARFWPKTECRNLLRWIGEANHAGYIRHVLAGIYAIEQIGTEEAITSIFRLTFHPNPEVQAAAERCREALQRRARGNRDGKDLLRPGARPVATSADLLRAASSTQSSDPSGLLRPDEAAVKRVD